MMMPQASEAAEARTAFGIRCRPACEVVVCWTAEK